MGMLDVTEDEEFIGENFMKILFWKPLLGNWKQKKWSIYKHIEWHDKKIYWRFNYWYWPWGNSANKDAKDMKTLLNPAMIFWIRPLW
jgi:hypothetical protein